MYPTQMYRDYIPNGPILLEEPNYLHYTIYYPVGFFKLKDGKIPYLQFRRKSQCTRYQWTKEFNPSDYVTDCFLDGSYPLWENEIELMRDLYDFINVDLSKKIYIGKMENTILKPYIKELYEGKKNNTGTVKYYYKILLNSLYGKFLSRPDGVIISYAGGYRHKEADVDRKTYYLPLGLWIAMMGRVTLHTVMNSIPYENVLYCDTDSVIFTGDYFPDVHIGPELGDWSIENDDFSANIVGPKTYQELKITYDHYNIKRQLITKCAGLSSIVLPTVNYGELKIGAKYEVLKSRRDKDNWAISLRKTEFEISDRLKVLRGS